jgi:hypothetical protein
MRRLHERSACSFPATIPSLYRSPESRQPYSYFPNGPLSVDRLDRRVIDFDLHRVTRFGRHRDRLHGSSPRTLWSRPSKVNIAPVSLNAVDLMDGRLAMQEGPGSGSAHCLMLWACASRWAADRGPIRPLVGSSRISPCPNTGGAQRPPRQPAGRAHREAGAGPPPRRGGGHRSRERAWGSPRACVSGSAIVAPRQRFGPPARLDPDGRGSRLRPPPGPGSVSGSRGPWARGGGRSRASGQSRARAPWDGHNGGRGSRRRSNPGACC